MKARTRVLFCAAVLALPPLAAQAQSYRCTDKDGKKYYGSTIPRQCIGQPVEELNRFGSVVRRIDPEGTDKERAAKEAAEAKKRDELAAQRESSRRNHALLATYTSAKDIDQARQRALAAHQKQVDLVEMRIAEIRKRQAGYEKELELYKGKGEPPAKLVADVRNAEADLGYQEEVLAAKRKEAEQIRARYDDDRKRYEQLTGGR